MREPGEIIEEVATRYGLTAHDLIGRKRHAQVKIARREAVREVYDRTNLTYAQVGKYFDNRSTQSIAALLNHSPATNPPVVHDIPYYVRRACRRHKVTEAQILGSTRAACVVRARQEVMLRAWKEGGYASTQIGRAMNRDHTTVLHGIKKANQRMESAHG